MVDTVRTIAELLTVFEDGQPADSITANDLRDVLVTLQARTGNSDVALQAPQQVNPGPTQTASVIFTHDPVPNYTAITHELVVTARNAAIESTYCSVRFPFILGHEAAFVDIFEGAPYAEVGTAGFIQFGAGTINLSWGSTAPDGSFFSVNVTNDHATDQQVVTCELR